MLLWRFACIFVRPRMMLFTLTVVTFALVTPPSDACAQGTRSRNASALAKQKSRQMAAIGINRLRKPYKSRYSTARYGMRHVGGGSLPFGARYEGVGYSAYSANQAIRNASFYGRRSMIVANVARGRDGYFATVYYR